MSAAATKSLDSVCNNFKQRTRLSDRRREAEKMKKSYPNKVPVIIERCPQEKNLENLDRCKYLVPSCFVAAQLIQNLRYHLKLNESQTLFLLANGKNVVGCTTSMAELYETEADDDGFLYILYASQEVFGH